jgi:Transposase IS4
MNQLIVPSCLFPDLIRFLTLMLLIGTTQRCSRREFWSTEDVDFLGANFHFNHFMSHRHFEAIIKYPKLTSTPTLEYKAPFHCVEELVYAFNEHTQRELSPSWIACLDESMSVWTSQQTCPGWMYVPCKPCPLGNEYHSMCCGLSGIMYSFELVEGKDQLHQSPPKNLKKRRGQSDYF